MASRKTFLAIVTSALVFGVAATGFSFNEDSIFGMVEDAAQFCPPALQTYLQENQQVVHWGAGLVGRWKRYRLDPQEMETVYRALVIDLQTGRAGDFRTAKRFGVLACFAAETILPGTFFGHGNDSELMPAKVVYQGYSEPPDLKIRTGYLVEQYRHKYWWNSDPETVRHLYQKTVNEIVDLWVSAWKAAGLDISGVAARGTTVSHDKIAMGK